MLFSQNIWNKEETIWLSLVLFDSTVKTDSSNPVQHLQTQPNKLSGKTHKEALGEMDKRLEGSQMEKE